MKHNLSVCLLIKDENEYLNEWLDWHISIGVDHFFIYDNGSTIPITDSIDSMYINRCTVVNFSGKHEHTQIESYLDCIERFGEETDWMAFIDTDEFIRVVDKTNFQLVLKEFRDADALVLKWVVYGADGQIYKSSKPVRGRFHEVAPYPEYLPQCKCVVRPKTIKFMGAHFPLGVINGIRIVNVNNQPVYNPTDQNIPTEKIVVDHYFTRSYEEWREKMARGSCDPCCERGNEWFEWMNPGLISSATEASIINNPNTIPK